MKDINLIPKSYFLEKKKKKIKFYIALACIFGLSLLIIAIVIPINLVISYQDKLKEIVAKVENTSGYTEKTKVLDEFHEIYENKKKLAEQIENFDNKELELFKKIEDAQVENVFIMSYKMAAENKDKRLLTLNCITNSKEEIIKFMENLRKEKFFKDIKLVSTTKITNSSVNNDSTNDKNNNGLPKDSTKIDNTKNKNILITNNKLDSIIELNY